LGFGLLRLWRLGLCVAAVAAAAAVETRRDLRQMQVSCLKYLNN